MFSRNTEPEIRYESSTSIFALMGAVGLGAALMYFLDPDNGRRRRALARDQLVHGQRVLQDATEAAVHNAANRTRGTIKMLQQRISTEEAVDDGVLVERVRAAMGHVIADPLAIDVRVHEGCVTLKGPARAEQIEEIVACAGRVRGVREVENHLSVSNPQ